MTLVHNITDVNDKIYEAAPGRSAGLARDATAWYLEDTAGFGPGMPDAQPLATETVPEIVELIGALIESGHAYAADGDVYFRVASFEGYGALGQRPDQVEEQEPNPAKEDPRDFALWKATKEDEDTLLGVTVGRGRPGGHIECSAMAAKELGPEFWIHGGGLDLVFPHHENERAQSVAAGHPSRASGCTTGCSASRARRCRSRSATWRRSARCWTNGAETARLLPHRALAEADRLLAGDHVGRPRAGRDLPQRAARTAHCGRLGRARRGARGRLQHARRLAVMHEWARTGALDELRRGLALFGLESLGAVEAAPAEVVALAEARVAARDAKDFAEADRLRDAIADAGWEVRDVPTRRSSSSWSAPRDPRPRLRGATPSARRCAVGAQCSRCGPASVPWTPWSGSARARARR